MSKRLKILVVDDEASICLFLSMSLSEDYDVLTANTLEQAEAALEQNDISLALVDLMLGKESGLDLLQSIKAEHPHVIVIMMTAYGDISTSVQSIRMGAYNYLLKPLNIEELRIFIRQALDYQKLNRRLDQLNEELETRNSYANMVGRSHAMQKVYALIDKLKEVDTGVMISGESGTGKELVARAIHYAGSRKSKPFIAMNCAAIPEGLLEEEFFGHKKGSFTSAYRDSPGKLELADGGTFFLDEVGELPLGLQSKLLRVIQEKETRPIGADEYRKIDVRFIAASNQNLREMVERKTFRQDLYYRLNIVEIRMPPLRERKQDIPLLCDGFLQKLSAEKRQNISGFTKKAEAKLMEYDYPGNVRELFNVIEYAMILCNGTVIDVDDLPENVRLGNTGAAGSGELEEVVREYLSGKSLQDVERAMIKANLLESGLSKKEIAERLGISERTLFYKIKEYGLTDAQ